VPRANVGDVADQLRPGPLGGEVTLHQVGNGDVVLAADRRGAEGPGLHCYQAQLAHQLADQLVTDLLTGPHQLGVDAPVAIGATELIEHLGDLGLELFAALFARARSAVAPLIKSGLRHPKPGQHSGERGSVRHTLGLMAVVLGGDERVLVAHRCSLAKYAAGRVARGTLAPGLPQIRA
jgi:hypothetical protein